MKRLLSMVKGELIEFDFPETWEELEEFVGDPDGDLLKLAQRGLLGAMVGAATRAINRGDDPAEVEDLLHQYIYERRQQ
jgi:hypothetical protein